MNSRASKNLALRLAREKKREAVTSTMKGKKKWGDKIVAGLKAYTAKY